MGNGIKFYKNYALASGFDVQFGSASKVNDRTCNGEGEKNDVHVESDMINGDD